MPADEFDLVISAMYLPDMSEQQRRRMEKRPRPEGLRPKTRHAALLVVRLGSPNLSPRALHNASWDSNAAPRVV